MIWLAMALLWIGGFCMGAFLLGRSVMKKPLVANGQPRLDELDRRMERQHEMHRVTCRPHRIGFEDFAAQHAIDLVMKFGQKYNAQFDDQSDMLARSIRLRLRLIAAGELRPDQPGRPLLVTAMRREKP